uniref:Uncharacterized protein n=1 Tax=Panagrolaimus sp. JU765 TaxID=591449 RepID=A0AC34Q630_9BILA
MTNGFESAIILARHSTDVRGINRYKHFHRPMQLPFHLLVPPNVSNNIDDKKLPPSAFLLPKISPNLSTKPESKSPLPRLKKDINAPKLFTYEKKHVNNALPPINKDKPQGNNSSQSCSSSSTFFTQSAPVESFQSSKCKLPELPRSVSFDQLEKQKSLKSYAKPTKSSTLKANSAVRTSVNSIPAVKKKRIKKVVESSTQTDETNIYVKNISQDSSTLTESLMGNDVTQKATQTERVTYLEAPPIPRKSLDRLSAHTIEEQSELFEVIYQALDETIDRRSRARTNKVIASTAKMQAEIWRDAKSFVTDVLLPSNICKIEVTRRELYSIFNNEIMMKYKNDN